MTKKAVGNEDIFSANDPLDINELASLNDDISTEFIEQLQNQIAQNASNFTGKPILTENNDAELFEEIQKNDTETKEDNSLETNKKQAENIEENNQTLSNEVETSQNNVVKEPEENIKKTKKTSKKETSEPKQATNENEIQNLTSGNIIEKPITQEQINYNESLNYLDDGIKYSKYVIYVNPENVDFIESLTTKERKNLINRILKEQNDIVSTKRKFNLAQTFIVHAIIAIITISISIPIVYWTINSSLEASINNHKRSQKIFKTLYKDKGKIRIQK